MTTAGPDILVLEDDIQRIEMMMTWWSPLNIYVTDFIEDFIAQASRGGWRLIMMDFDLSPKGQGPTGLDAAEVLGDPASDAFKACCYTPVLVHSLNLRRAYEIVGALWQWDAPVVRLPFHLIPGHLPWLKQMISAGEG